MTIRVKVTNEGTGEAAVVVLRSINGKTGDAIPGSPPRELSGGQSCNEFVVHGECSLLIHEPWQAEPQRPETTTEVPPPEPLPIPAASNDVPPAGDPPPPAAT